MPGFRDSRFGQFADPNFGASLYAPQQSQGVLPAPGAAPSASDPGAGQSASQTWGTPGLMGQNNASNPGSIYLAEGGAIPGDDEGAQDSGDAAPPSYDPFSVVKSALAYGRKQSGLPAQFFGGGGAQQNFAEGGPVNDNDADDQGGPSDNDADDQGVIPSGNPAQEDQGQQGGMSPSGNAPPNPQAAMGYLTGQGAVGPDIAASLEQQVDPQGTMDPNQRKMLAVARAGSPDKAFAVLQHYRQKFNAYNAFAKAAAQGGNGRPPDLHASAHAATQAYQHLPDGKAVSFQPVPNGMRVSVRDVSGGQQSQDQGQDQSQDQGQQNFAEGGEVEYETAGARPWASDPRSIQQQQQAVDDGSADNGPPQGADNDPAVSAYQQGQPDNGSLDMQYDPSQDPMGAGQSVEGEGKDTKGGAGAALRMGVQGAGRAIAKGAKAVMDGQDMSSITKPAGAIKDFVLSIPQYLQWLTKDGQADSVLDKGVENTLPQFAPHTGAAPGMDARAQQGQQAMAQGTAAPQQQAPQQPQPQQGQQQPQQGQQQHIPSPKDPEQFGSQVGAEAKDEGLTIRDAMHQLDIAYGNWAGQQKAKALAKAALIKEYAVEKVKGQNSLDRARITGQYGVQKAQTTGELGIQKGLNHETASTGRNAATNTSREGIAQGNREAANQRTEYVQQQTNNRADTLAKPSLVGNKDKIDQAQAARGGPARMQRPQQPASVTGGQQPSARDIEYLRKNPNVAMKFDARFGAGAAQRVLGQ